MMAAQGDTCLLWLRRAIAALALTTTVAVCGGPTANADTPIATTSAQPSFDCGKAKAPLETAICADPALSLGDRALAESYSKAQAQVPPEWRDALRKTQRSWLAYMAVICMPGDLERRESGATVASCRRDEFNDRTEALAATLYDQSGYSFVELTSYAAHPAAADDIGAGDPPRSTQSQVLLLQIARPADAAERQWNEMIARRMTQIMTESTATADKGYVVIDSAAPGFIQATINRSDERGPGGDSVSLISIAWSLRLGRQLAVADIFRDPAAGVAAVARLAMRNMEKNAVEAGEPFDLKLADVRGLVAPMRYWSLTKAGLALTFDSNGAFGGAHYAAATLSTTLPWSDLAPYLRKDLPFDIKSLRDPP